MTAFDTDVLSDIVNGHATYQLRLQTIPEPDRCVPVVVLEETFRGRLDGIRKAQAGQVRIPLNRAYDLFMEAVEGAKEFRLLPHTPAADALFKQWRAAKLRVGSQDLRIAAICLDHGATLVTRNARDYAQVSGLTLDIWN
jgi:tRNA(fMet)-specific endonuclease VapC